MRLYRNPEIAIRKIDNELFIYNREKALIHTFNRTGAFLWEAIEGGLGPGAIAGRLTDTFDVPAAEASADLAAFIEKLKELNLVSEAPA